MHTLCFVDIAKVPNNDVTIADILWFCPLYHIFAKNEFNRKCFIMTNLMGKCYPDVICVSLIFREIEHILIFSLVNFLFMSFAHISLGLCLSSLKDLFVWQREKPFVSYLLQMCFSHFVIFLWVFSILKMVRGQIYLSFSLGFVIS